MPSPPLTPLPDAEKEPDFYGEIWLNYPLDSTLQPMHLGSTWHALLRHGILLHEFATKRAKADVEATRRAVYELALGLKIWYHSLPSILQPSKISLPLHYKIQ